MKNPQFFLAKISFELLSDTFLKPWDKIPSLEKQVGDILEIACIDCRLTKQLENGEWEIEVISEDSTKVLTCLLCEIDDAKNTRKTLIDNEEKAEANFYYNRAVILRKIIQDLCNDYKLQKCCGCTEFVDFTQETTKDGDKDYHSQGCKYASTIEFD